jgi:outer membrane protein assembly factor BamB
MWLQWTASPPSVGDIDGDGLNEVIGVPNAEQDEPYHTYHYAFMVLEGDYAANNHRSARRLAGWEELPLTEEPLYNDDWYPPQVIPSPTLANIEGDSRPEIIAPIPDGYVYAFSPEGNLLWRYNYAQGLPLLYATEVTVADLSRDGRPEIIFGTYGEPGEEWGRLVILASNGTILHSIKLPNQNIDSGNGVGPCAAPTVADLNNDGKLEILVLTIDHGLDIFETDGSSSNCTMPGADPDLYPGLWPTGRGNYLRNGRAPGQ